MGVSHREIYARHADQYNLLVSREDYQLNIFQKLNQLVSLDSMDVIELGAGTGRLTRILAPVVRTIQALDASHSMLEVARDSFQEAKLRNWGATVADNRRLPIASSTADLVISGWSLCYLVVWSDNHWRSALVKALEEMTRILRPGGSVIILETMGTGHETPHPPDSLMEYYSYLEQEGFESTWIRTDYRFETVAEAEMLVRFFFGVTMAEKVARDELVILPECTGIWWKRV